MLFELAIIRELIQIESSANNGNSNELYALYLAPLKAIVEEKYKEWQQRFVPFNLNCFPLTGDTEHEICERFRLSNYSQVNILLATPEKFDSLIRTQSNSRQLLNLLRLVMIDEIHMLGDPLRGKITRNNLFTFFNFILINQETH